MKLAALLLFTLISALTQAPMLAIARRYLAATHVWARQLDTALHFGFPSLYALLVGALLPAGPLLSLPVLWFVFGALLLRYSVFDIALNVLRGLSPGYLGTDELTVRAVSWAARILHLRPQLLAAALRGAGGVWAVHLLL